VSENVRITSALGVENCRFELCFLESAGDGPIVDLIQFRRVNSRTKQTYEHRCVTSPVIYAMLRYLNIYGVLSLVYKKKIKKNRYQL